MHTHIAQLIDLFMTHCSDRGTLDELRRMVSDKQSWHKAHDLFDRIRKKTLEAERRRDGRAGWQYAFEEICAKALYNMTDTDVPFDEDSPYWVVPIALSLARQLGIRESEVTKIVAG